MSRTYSLRDADAILPEIAVVVQRLQGFRDELIALRDTYRAREGVARGGSIPDEDDPDRERDLLRLRLRTRGLVDQMQADTVWLDERGIVLRDIPTGLIDLPGEANGEPIWLCWRLGEASITAWHTQSEGFAGRRPIEELGEAS